MIKNPGIILPNPESICYNESRSHIEINIDEMKSKPNTEFCDLVFSKHSHVYHLYVVRHSARDILQDYLTKNGIQSMIHYPIPPHKQKANLEMNSLQLPITEKIHQEVLSLPISQVIEYEEMNNIVRFLNSFDLD